MAHGIAEGDTCGAGHGHGQGLLTGVGFADALLQGGIGADCGGPFGQLWQIDARMPTVQVHMPRRQFADLAEAAANAQFIHGHLAQMLEHCTDEIAHFDQGDFRQVVDPAHGVFAGVAGAGGDVQVTVGFRHVDALVDRGDVGRAGKRPDDAAGAEDRQAAENAQARVHGFQRQGLAVLDVHRDLETAAVAEFRGEQRQVITDHPARYRIDRRLANA
ncbi:hypothetical protein D3C76_1090850 [compost metagenome]